MAEEKLLTVTETAEILSTTEDWLYHHWKTLPFAFKVSPKQLRFSLQGLHEYLGEKRHARQNLQEG
ncbi:hypothetical protein D3C83_178050 [compost metagenome]|jgi:hypothetical protein